MDDKFILPLPEGMSMQLQEESLCIQIRDGVWIFNPKGIFFKPNDKEPITVAKPPENNGWIRVEDERPDNNRDVLVVANDVCEVGYYVLDSWWSDAAHRISGVTHWRELPDLPEEVEE